MSDVFSPKLLFATIKTGLINTYLTKGWPTYDGKTLHRASFLSASEAMNCDMRLYFDKVDDQEPEPVVVAPGSIPMEIDPSQNQGIFVRGHAVEGAIVDALHWMFDDPDKVQIVLTGSDQRSFYSMELMLSGTPDGGLVYRGDGVVPGLLYGVEIKSFDPRSNIIGAKPNHVVQLQQNVGLIRETGWHSRVADTGFLIYVNAADYFDLRIYPVDTSVTTVDNVIVRNTAKAHSIFAAIDAKDPMSLPATGVNTGECKFCPHASICPARQKGQSSLPPAAAAAGAAMFGGKAGGQAAITGPGAARKAAQGLNSGNVLSQQPVAKVVITDDAQLVDDYMAVLAQIKELEEEQAEIKAAILATEQAELLGTKGVITVTTVKGRESFDSKSFLADNPFPEEKLSPYRKVGEASTRLDVKPL